MAKIEFEFDECPKCGNKDITYYISTELTRFYTKNGRCKQKSEGSTLHWGYSCDRCKWVEAYSE